MRLTRNSIALPILALAASLTVAYADNSFYLYTGALKPTDDGVVRVPSRFLWSVETNVAGFDLQGRPLPDSRIMLRLYDPDHNCTAITAQMDLETADKLQRELADLIAKKRRDPDYQFNPQLWDPSLIPTGEIIGINKNGEAIVELHYENDK